MRTGETVLALGLYSTECCNEEKTFDVGDTFIRCPRCMHLCAWDCDEELEASDNQELVDVVTS
jgi:hypothetical protein